MGISKSSAEAVQAQFHADWGEAPPPLKWLRELSFTEKVSIFFNELIKSISRPSEQTLFFPNYCFGKDILDLINGVKHQTKIIEEMQKEILQYRKELACKESQFRTFMFCYDQRPYRSTKTRYCSRKTIT